MKTINQFNHSLRTHFETSEGKLREKNIFLLIEKFSRVYLEKKNRKTLHNNFIEII